MILKLHILDFENRKHTKFQFNWFIRGAKGDWDFRISDLVKNSDETDI